MEEGLGPEREMAQERPVPRVRAGRLGGELMERVRFGRAGRLGQLLDGLHGAGVPEDGAGVPAPAAAFDAPAVAWLRGAGIPAAVLGAQLIPPAGAHLVQGAVGGAHGAGVPAPAFGVPAVAAPVVLAALPAREEEFAVLGMDDDDEDFFGFPDLPLPRVLVPLPDGNDQDIAPVMRERRIRMFRMMLGAQMGGRRGGFRCCS